jgi:hypothetical protein
MSLCSLGISGESNWRVPAGASTRVSCDQLLLPADGPAASAYVVGEGPGQRVR